MRILHTADLHLKEDNSKIIDALENILKLGEKKKIDLLTIGGDIFDSPQDADSLRTRIRGMFDNIPFEIVAIPGNHDERIFTKGFDFGFPVCIERPWKEFIYDDVNIIAMPYSNVPPTDLLPSLKKK